MPKVSPEGYSVKQLATELGSSAVTVTKKLRAAGTRPLTPQKPYRYDLADAIQAFTGHGSGAKAYEAARTRKMEAEATVREIDAARKRNEVVDVELAERLILADYAKIRSKLLVLPDKMAAILDMTPGVIAKRKLMNDAIHEVLEELSSDSNVAKHLRTDPEVSGDDWAESEEASTAA